MIDADLLLFTLLRDGAPGAVGVLPEIDTDAIERLPVWMFHINGTGQTSNGPGLWQVTLDMDVIGEGIDATRPLARAAYDLVHRWKHPAISIVPGVGWVSDVDDLSLFSLQPTPKITGRQVSHYQGSFSLALRN